MNFNHFRNIVSDQENTCLATPSHSSSSSSSAAAAIQYVEKQMEPKQYEIGIKFLDMSEKDSETLKEFITSLEDKNKVFNF